MVFIAKVCTRAVRGHDRMSVVAALRETTRGGVAPLSADPASLGASGAADDPKVCLLRMSRKLSPGRGQSCTLAARHRDGQRTLQMPT